MVSQGAFASPTGRVWVRITYGATKRPLVDVTEDLYRRIAFEAFPHHIEDVDADTLGIAIHGPVGASGDMFNQIARMPIHDGDELFSISLQAFVDNLLYVVLHMLAHTFVQFP